MSPYSYLQAPLQAFMRGEDWRESANMAVKATLEPWVAGNPGFSNVFDEFSEADGLPEIGDLFQAMASSITPGAVEQYNRTLTGRNSNLNEVDRQSELASLFTGLKPQEQDVREGLGFDALDFRNAKRDSFREVRRAQNRGGVTTRQPEFIAEVNPFADTFGEVVDQGVDAQVEAYQTMTRKVRAARTLGMTATEIDSILKDRGINATDRGIVLAGSLPPEG